MASTALQGRPHLRIAFTSNTSGPTTSNGTGAINLTGNALANPIHGNEGANVLNGKDGKDTLNGYGGADIFVFDTVPHDTLNSDTITDFDGTQDTIRLAKSVFTALTGNAGTTLSADQFVVGRRGTRCQ